jgi:hypothetical protein
VRRRLLIAGVPAGTRIDGIAGPTTLKSAGPGSRTTADQADVGVLVDPGELREVQQQWLLG